jgi:hypothetical protein
MSYMGVGRKAPTVSGSYGNFKGEVTSDLKHRPEGIRLKHYVNGNSVKMYDKQGSVLRIETTIIRPNDFKVFRGTDEDPEAKQWRKMRKGVADLQRRAEVSQQANGRYLEAMGSVEVGGTLKQMCREVCQAVVWEDPKSGKRRRTPRSSPLRHRLKSFAERDALRRLPYGCSDLGLSVPQPVDFFSA